MLIITCEITPALALQLLQNLAPDLYDGQPADLGKINDYAGMMLAGKWDHKIADAPISISNKQRLTNGFHRLSAVVESGKTITDRIAFFTSEGMFFEMPGEHEPGRFSQPILACADFILGALGTKSFSRTMIKVHDHLRPIAGQLTPAPTALGAFAPAMMTAKIYAAAGGMDAAKIDRKCAGVYPAKGETERQFFERCCRTIFGIADDNMTHFNLLSLLPPGLHSYGDKSDESSSACAY